MVRELHFVGDWEALHLALDIAGWALRTLCHRQYSILPVKGSVKKLLGNGSERSKWTQCPCY